MSAQVATEAGKGTAATSAPPPPPVQTEAAPGAGAQPGTASSSTTQPGAGTTPADGQADKATTPPAEFAIKLPDGVSADAQLLGALQDVAKESGLKPEHGQKLADAYVNAMQRAQQAEEQQWEAQKQKWKDALSSDPKLGGGNLQTTHKVAQDAIRRFCDADLVQFLEQTGVGDHPGLVRAFYGIGKALQEDRVAGTAQAPAQASGPEAMFESLYPFLKPKT